MKNRIIHAFLFVLLTMGLYAQERNKSITGIVSSAPENAPIANALVTIKGTFIETETNANGAFNLNVSPDDDLVITAFLMESKEISVSGKNAPLSIQLDYNAELLEAVSIREKQEKKDYLETGMGKQHRNGIGFSADEMQERFISGADVDMYTVARKMPFLYVEGDQLGSQVVYSSRMRGAMRSSRVPMQVIVDGVPVEQNALAIINPSLIENITLLRSLAATIRYGSIGVGGVMIITTKNSGSASIGSKVLPSLLVKGNNYQEGILPISEKIEMATQGYIVQLKPYANVEDALNLYDEQRKQPETYNLAYYIDMSSYFARWGDTYGYQVLSDLYEQANENPRILKTIAFILEERGHLVQATYTLEQLVELRPDYIQTYRDLARLYTQTGKYNLAATLYKQMVYNTVPNVDFEPIQPIIFNEFRNLIANHKSKIDYKNIPNEFLSVNFKKDVRIVLEYTNPLAEFEVQFVSPDKKYYTWRHTYFDSKDLIEEEISTGYALKEFIIEDSGYGNWLVNVKSLNTTPGTNPTFLKYTLYQNYGLPNEKKEVKVLNLAQHTEKVTLDTFIY